MFRAGRAIVRTVLSVAAGILLSPGPAAFAQAPTPPPAGAERQAPTTKTDAKGGEGKVQSEAKESPDEKEKGGEEKKDGEKAKKEEDEEKKKDEEEKKDTGPGWYIVHAQATVVSQGNWPFRSPYVGPLSLLPNLNYRTTETTTLFLDAWVLPGSEIIFNPEVSGGDGLSGTSGLAGFPNGEATRVGVPPPTPYIARLFWRQTIGLGGEQEKLPDATNQVSRTVDVNRITLRIGKMAATDLFDDNAYSHNPRTQFLNWSLMYNGAWDYPANFRGYTYGGTIELNHKDWAIRYAVFAEPAEANGAPLDPHILKASGHALEFERRYESGDHPGKLRLLAYLNNAHMGDYRVALQAIPVNPDITLTRAYRVKYGFGVNWEQELTKDAGRFARVGWNDGHTESWAFTEIDATAALGVLIKGTNWGRPADRLGLAVVANGLSNGHRDYLAAGGLGFIIGDGRLHYAPEEIIETFYNLQLREGVTVGFGCQGVNHPAYNQDRGPVEIAAVRLHLEY
jgi:high affinity Mn2+ porin